MRSTDFANDGARRHRQNDVRAGAARFVGAHAMLASLRRPAIAIRVIEQRREVVVAAHDDVATAPAVAAVGTTHGHELLAAERAGARPAGACFHTHHYTINEHDQRTSCAVTCPALARTVGDSGACHRDRAGPRWRRWRPLLLRETRPPAALRGGANVAADPVAPWRTRSQCTALCAADRVPDARAPSRILQRSSMHRAPGADAECCVATAHRTDHTRWRTSLPPRPAIAPRARSLRLRRFPAPTFRKHVATPAPR